MSKESSSGTVGMRFKKELMVITFVVSLLAFFWGAITLNSWVKFGAYRKLATELNTVLGGGYRISYNWNCSIDSTNCPSVRMIKDANFATNDEAKKELEGYVTKLQANGFENPRILYCEPVRDLRVYCEVEGKKDNKTIAINAKEDFIGVDIEP